MAQIERAARGGGCRGSLPEEVAREAHVLPGQRGGVRQQCVGDVLASAQVGDGIGVQEIEHHRKEVRFFSTVELVNALEQEKAQGRAGQIAERLVRLDLVILDELGYLLFSASGGALLFHLLSKFYERTSAVITTNLSFSEWGIGLDSRPNGRKQTVWNALISVGLVLSGRLGGFLGATTARCRPARAPGSRFG